MEEVRIEPLRHEELPEAVEVVAGAMSTTPLLMTLFQRQEDKMRCQNAVFRGVLGRLPGQVLVAKEDSRIVGVMHMVEWPRCQLSLLQELRLLPIMLYTLKSTTVRVLNATSVWFKYAPKEPHWHVDLLAVLPEMQGQGIESRLLERFCEQADKTQQPAYLHMDNPQNIRLCEQFGFLVAGEAPVLGVTNWFMWRPPHQPAHQAQPCPGYGQ